MVNGMTMHRLLTAADITLSSVESTLPPGNAVSPIYRLIFHVTRNIK